MGKREWEKRAGIKRKINQLKRSDDSYRVMMLMCYNLRSLYT